jgi:hypothetical protein
MQVRGYQLAKSDSQNMRAQGTSADESHAARKERGKEKTKPMIVMRSYELHLLFLITYYYACRS